MFSHSVSMDLKRKEDVDMAEEKNQEGFLERFGLGLAAWSEKWFPDAWVFALLGIVIVFCFGLLIGESPDKLAIEGG